MGLEPILPKKLDFESSASTNSATPPSLHKQSDLIKPGNRDTTGLTTVAPIKAWRGLPADNPQPLTATN